MEHPPPPTPGLGSSPNRSPEHSQASGKQAFLTRDLPQTQGLCFSRLSTGALLSRGREGACSHRVTLALLQATQAQTLAPPGIAHPKLPTPTSPAATAVWRMARDAHKATSAPFLCLSPSPAWLTSAVLPDASTSARGWCRIPSSAGNLGAELGNLLGCAGNHPRSPG